MFSITAKELANIVGGRLDGSPDVVVNGLSKIEEGTKGSLSFLAHPKYLSYAYTSKSSIIILNEGFTLEQSVPKDCTLIWVKEARATFSGLINHYAKLIIPDKKGIESPVFVGENSPLDSAKYIGALTYIGKNVQLGKNVTIYPGCYIGDSVVIGEETVLYAGVKVYDRCTIGKHCIIQSGAVIGSDGFGFNPNADNQYDKIQHIGIVVVEDYVEIGSNTTIDKATIGETRICKGVKLDNLIQIAHNVVIGENTVMAAQTGVAGSTKIGKNCMIGGQVGIVGHLTLADGTKIAAQSGVGHDVIKENSIIQGSPAYEIGDYKRSYVLFKNLPSLKKEVDELKKELKSLALK